MKTIHQSLNDRAYFHGFLHDRPGPAGQQHFPTIVIVPGGSFTHIPEPQAEQVALAFFARGFNAVYLRYSFISEISPILPRPLIELGQTMVLLKDHSDWPVDANQVLILGMSAGGLVTALYNDYWSSSWLTNTVGATASQLEPRATILCYPVIDVQLGFPTTATTRATWTNDRQRDAAEQHITAANKPTFIWATAEDQAVPITNSLAYATALYEHQIPLESHIFNHGPHGLALADQTTAWKPGTDLPHVAHWFELALEWITDLLTDD